MKSDLHNKIHFHAFDHFFPRTFRNCPMQRHGEKFNFLPKKYNPRSRKASTSNYMYPQAVANGKSAISSSSTLLALSGLSEYTSRLKKNKTIFPRPETWTHYHKSATALLSQDSNNPQLQHHDAANTGHTHNIADDLVQGSGTLPWSQQSAAWVSSWAPWPPTSPTSNTATVLPALLKVEGWSRA